MDTIDLRSDTVTFPTPKMREAMLNAPLGDDVYGEDPTVNTLEAEAAALLGKEAGLFVASGTQGNLIAALTHCERGAEMIVGKQAHMFVDEVGGVSALGGIHSSQIEVQPDGTLLLEVIKEAIRDQDIHYPRTRLICLENTQNFVGGIPVPAAYIQQVAEIAQSHHLKLHIDGARLFNAAVALGVEACELVEGADSVSFCLSKGLCAPVGSVLVGSREFITEARRMRKVLGGGMRQAGILAAAGLVAIREMIPRLAEDHQNACRLAEGLVEIPAIHLDASQVKTNMVYFELNSNSPLDGKTLGERLRRDYNVYLMPYLGNKFRAVTHYWISAERVDSVIHAMRVLLQ